MSKKAFDSHRYDGRAACDRQRVTVLNDNR